MKMRFSVKPSATDTHETATKTPVNVLLVMTDQHRHDWTGFNGGHWCRTPNLDRLAASGTVVSGCCTNAPVCAPARCSLATGLDPHHCGVLCNSHNLDPEFPTLYKHLRDHGWWTGYVGKLDLAKGIGDREVGEDGRMPALFAWGFCDPRDSGGVVLPNKADRRPYFRHLESKGLLETFNADRAARVLREGVFCAMRSGSVDPRDLPCDWIAQNAGDSLLAEDDHTDGFCGALAERWLEEACLRTEPFFLQVNFHGPHDPYDPPAEWARLFRDAPVPPAVSPPEQATSWQNRKFASAHAPSIAHARRQYSATVAMIDNRIGRMIELLERCGRLENTLIIFTSDHGDMMGDLGLFAKNVPYEGGLRVPLMMAGPGIPSGRCSNTIVELADLHPTICDLLGLPVPEGLDARSLAPVIRGQAENHRSDALTMLDHFVCLRTADWKYVLYSDGAEELYDLVNDPGEREELIAQNRREELLRQARARLNNRVGTSYRGPKPGWWDFLMDNCSLSKEKGE